MSGTGDQDDSAREVDEEIEASERDDEMIDMDIELWGHEQEGTALNDDVPSGAEEEGSEQSVIEEEDILHSLTFSSSPESSSPILRPTISSSPFPPSSPPLPSSPPALSSLFSALPTLLGIATDAAVLTSSFLYRLTPCQSTTALVVVPEVRTGEDASSIPLTPTDFQSIPLTRSSSLLLTPSDLQPVPSYLQPVPLNLQPVPFESLLLSPSAERAARTIQRVLVHELDPIMFVPIRKRFALLRSGVLIAYDAHSFARYVEARGDERDPVARQPLVRHEWMRLDRLVGRKVQREGPTPVKLAPRLLDVEMQRRGINEASAFYRWGTGSNAHLLNRRREGGVGGTSVQGGSSLEGGRSVQGGSSLEGGRNGALRPEGNTIRFANTFLSDAWGRMGERTLTLEGGVVWRWGLESDRETTAIWTPL